MFETLLIHPRTLLQLQQFAMRPTHGLLLIGPEGAGKQTLAAAIAANILNIDSTDLLNTYPYYSFVNPNDASIGIDEIRSLERILKLKTPSHNTQEIRRVITVIDAGRMRFEAQNAFLKNLEEPPADTTIIMTAQANGALLPTIYSRMRVVEVLPVSESQSATYYQNLGVQSMLISRSYAMSQGQAGLLHSLLYDESHPLKDAVEIGKQLLAMPQGQRLFKSDEYSKDKTAALVLLDALGRIAHAALMHAGKTGNTSAIKRWQNSLTAVQETLKATHSNANTKLLLDQLFLSL